MDDVIELGPQCHERYFCGAEYPNLAPHGIPAAGWSDLAGHYRVERRLDMHLIEVTLAGHGLGVAAPWRGTLGAGSALLVPAGTAFRITTDAGQPWTTAWALLEPRRWRGFPPRVQVHHDLPTQRLLPLLALLDAERHGDDTAAAPLRRAFGDALVLWLQRLVQGPGGVAGAQRAALQALFDRVRMQPAEHWSTERLAALAGCSRSQLHRRCVEVFGRSPSAQVTRVRMQEAEFWLSTTRLPLKTVGERLGFANPYHFSTAFKRWSGVAPARYRLSLPAASAASTPSSRARPAAA